jgi:hypothetical protein
MPFRCRQGRSCQTAVIDKADRGPQELATTHARRGDFYRSRGIPERALTALRGEEAAKIGGMDRQTLRDWVIRLERTG